MDPIKEKEAADAYAEAGVEFQEAPITPEKPEPVEEPEEVAEVTPEEEPKTEEQEPEEPEVVVDEKPKKRSISIYKDLKDKRSKVKEKEARIKELEDQLASNTPAEIAKVDDDIEAFAKEIDADPAMLSRLRDVLFKGQQPAGLSEEQAKQLKEFQEFHSSNSEAVDKVNFDKEFKASAPALKELFPNATAEENEIIKDELEKLAHSEAFHDKELDYIAFKNKATLKTLISPKKKGMESKGRVDATKVSSSFDPNADLSKLSPTEADAWEQEYAKATKSEELATDGEGRKIII